MFFVVGFSFVFFFLFFVFWHFMACDLSSWPRLNLCSQQQKQWSPNPLTTREFLWNVIFLNHLCISAIEEMFVLTLCLIILLIFLLFFRVFNSFSVFAKCGLKQKIISSEPPFWLYFILIFISNIIDLYLEKIEYNNDHKHQIPHANRNVFTISPLTMVVFLAGLW